MNDEKRDVETPVEQAVEKERAEWHQPQWRRIDASEAQAGSISGADGGSLS